MRVRASIAIVAAWLVAASAAAAPPVRALFERAAMQEQTVRAALAEPDAPADLLKSIRRAITAYESIVRLYPNSGYSDDALWQGAQLALDAFKRFGNAQDRSTGVKLLKWLASEYPASKLAKQAPRVLAALDEAVKEPAAPAPSTATKEPAKPLATPPPATTPTAAATPAAAAAVTPAPRPVVKPASLTHIQRSVLPDVVRVTIALDSEVAYHEERLAGPARIFVDFSSTRAAAALLDQTLRFDQDADVMRQVRIGRQPNTTTRVVLDAAGISSYSVYPLYAPYRLVVDLVRATPPPLAAVQVPAASAAATPPVTAPAKAPLPTSRPGPAAASPAPAVASGTRPTPPKTVEPVKAKPPLSARSSIPAWTRTLPSVSAGETAALEAAHLVPPLNSRSLIDHVGRVSAGHPPSAVAAIAEALAPPPAVLSNATAAANAAAAPAPGLSAGFSMARQLGLGVSRIVIDPGHGGHDPGAKGKGGLTEAELVLDVSLRLQKLLEDVKGVEVILTRSTDEFVALPERTAIANREGADLFLSIHANASPNEQAHGIETYFLNFANNLSAAAVAARENATSGQAMGALPDFVKAIALNNKLDESRDFATLVQQTMVMRLGATNKSVKNLGVKQAPFVVLIGASMPSVLAEISFLTHPQEARLLKSTAYRQSIAEALFEAVRQYQGSLQRVQTIAQQ